jgi:hypothetical protein
MSDVVPRSTLFAGGYGSWHVEDTPVRDAPDHPTALEYEGTGCAANAVRG